MGSSSSGEEDGDAEWRAAIDSVATSFGVPATNGHVKTQQRTGNITSPSTSKKPEEDNPEEKSESRAFKLYEIKAQKLLDDLLEKRLSMVRDPTPAMDEIFEATDSGIHLFSQAPPGIIFDPVDDFQRPRKRPTIASSEINEKSKKFRRHLKSVAVDGADVVAAAKDTCQRSSARFEAKDAATKAAAKREEERVAELKRIRGERWLPSIAREMQLMKLVNQSKARK